MKIGFFIQDVGSLVLSFLDNECGSEPYMLSIKLFEEDVISQLDSAFYLSTLNSDYN